MFASGTRQRTPNMVKNVAYRRERVTKWSLKLDFSANKAQHAFTRANSYRCRLKPATKNTDIRK
jgi:hypothetical protein